jgi:hypothetical protein
VPGFCEIGAGQRRSRIRDAGCIRGKIRRARTGFYQAGSAMRLHYRQLGRLADRPHPQGQGGAAINLHRGRRIVAGFEQAPTQGRGDDSGPELQPELGADWGDGGGPQVLPEGRERTMKFGEKFGDSVRRSGTFGAVLFPCAVLLNAGSGIKKCPFSLSFLRVCVRCRTELQQFKALL